MQNLNILLRIIDNQTKLFLRDDFTFDKETEIGLEAVPPQGLYTPKWNGESWEEGATEEYIDELKSHAEPPKPTIEEKVEEHDVKIVTLEDTIDTIFGGGE